MNDSYSTASLRTAFTFPFQSPGWQTRFLIGAALLFASAFIPIIPVLFVYGYVVEVMRQVIDGEAPVLPEWNKWGQFALDGLKSGVIGIVYMGPGLLIIIAGWVLYMVMYFSGMIMLTSTPSHGEPSGFSIALLLGAVGSLFLSMFVGWFFIMLGGIPLPAALAHFVAQDRLGAAFHVRELNAILRADKWGYFIGWVVVVGLGGVMYFAIILLYSTLVLACLIYFIAAPIGLYLLLVSAVVFGQFYRDSLARLHPQVVERADPEANPL